MLILSTILFWFLLVQQKSGPTDLVWHGREALWDPARVEYNPLKLTGKEMCDY